MLDGVAIARLAGGEGRWRTSASTATLPREVSWVLRYNSLRRGGLEKSVAQGDKRFQVFVSSTYFDLQEERQAVIMALLQLDAIPAGMELFPAADDDAWSLIKSVIDDCDYYLLVIGGRYGSVDPADQLSYTEKEYDYAIAAKKPVMAFLHGDPNSIPTGKAELSESAQQKLREFRLKVEAGKHVKYWRSAEDLAGKVALTFGHFVRAYPAIGWMRADQQSSAETLAELNELRKQLAVSEARLDAARTLPPPGTDALASGSDYYETELVWQASFRGEGAKEWRPKAGSTRIRPTWDELFAAVGPLLLDEARVDDMEEAIDTWASARFRLEALREAREQLTADGLDPKTTLYRSYSAHLGHDEFQPILVQFIALGLIVRSERRRSVKDKETYWTLTPFGNTRVIQLRAVKREPSLTLPLPPADDDEFPAG